MMRQFDSEDEDAEVPDPYYGGERGFQEVFDILDRSIEGFITYLQNQELTRKVIQVLLPLFQEDSLHAQTLRVLLLR